MKNLWAVVVLLGGVLTASLAHAVNPKVIETDWNYIVKQGSTTSNGTVFYVESDTMTVTTIGHEWAAKAVGGMVDFTISIATEVASGGGIFRSTSTTIRVLDGDVARGRFHDLSPAPVFTVKELSAPTTFYLWVEYGKKRTN